MGPGDRFGMGGGERGKGHKCQTFGLGNWLGGKTIH